MISNILGHSVDAQALKPTRYLSVKPNVYESLPMRPGQRLGQRRRNEISNIGEILELRGPSSDTGEEWNKFVKNYKPNHFEIYESASALRGFASQFRLDGMAFFGPREYMQRTKLEILSLMRENRRTRGRMILNCEMVKDKLFNENVGPHPDPKGVELLNPHF